MYQKMNYSTLTDTCALNELEKNTLFLFSSSLICLHSALIFNTFTISCKKKYNFFGFEFKHVN